MHFGNEAGPECFAVLFHSSQSVGVAPIMWRVCLGRGVGDGTQGFSVPLSALARGSLLRCWKNAVTTFGYNLS